MKPLDLTDPDLNWRTRKDAERASAAMRQARHARNVDVIHAVVRVGISIAGALALLSLLS